MNKLLVIVFSLSLFTVPMLGQRGQVSLEVDPGNDTKVEVRQGGTVQVLVTFHPAPNHSGNVQLCVGSVHDRDTSGLEIYPTMALPRIPSTHVYTQCGSLVSVQENETEVLVNATIPAEAVTGEWRVVSVSYAPAGKGDLAELALKDKHKATFTVVKGEVIIPKTASVEVRKVK
jgi:hypothetical protein